MTVRLLLSAALILTSSLMGCLKDNPSSRMAPPEKKTLTGDCSPSFLRLSKEPLVVLIGQWEVGLDAFVLGCSEHLDKLKPEERDSMANFMRRRLETKGLPSGIQLQDPSFRSKLAGELNAIIGRQIVTDVLLVTRYSIESEPDLKSEYPSQEGQRFNWN